MVATPAEFRAMPDPYTNRFSLRACEPPLSGCCLAVQQRVSPERYCVTGWREGLFSLVSAGHAMAVVTAAGKG